VPAPQVNGYGPSMPQADINGVTIGYDSCGDDEPLLPVMGFGGQLTDWCGGPYRIEAHRT
jgi:hypothetical protein